MMRASKENPSILLKNLISVHHMELARGAMAWLRARNLLPKPAQLPPSRRDIERLQGSKRKLVFEDPALVEALKAGEFNEDDEIVDSRGQAVMQRVKCGSRYVYSFCRDNTLHLYDLDNLYNYGHSEASSGPDSWCGDYFLDSFETPILFRCRGVAASEVQYFRIVTPAQMTALVANDEVEYQRLRELNEQTVYDACADSDEDRADEEEEEVDETEVDEPVAAQPVQQARGQKAKKLMRRPESP
jgi:hypothetical protein